MFPGMAEMGLPPRPGAIEELDEIEEIETPEVEVEESMGVDISPDAVCYRDEQSVCGNCSYMGQTGECAALKMTVDPGAGCNLFMARGM